MRKVKRNDVLLWIEYAAKRDMKEGMVCALGTTI